MNDEQRAEEYFKGLGPWVRAGIAGERLRVDLEAALALLNDQQIRCASHKARDLWVERERDSVFRDNDEWDELVPVGDLLAYYTILFGTLLRLLQESILASRAKKKESVSVPLGPSTSK